MVTAYLLTSTATTPLWGKISDLYRTPADLPGGHRHLPARCSALSGLSQDMGQLIAFRALQGVGGGGLFAIALSIIGDVIPPRERGRYQGYFEAVFGLDVAGPLLGGWLTDGPGWRWIFYINLPVGLAALVVTSAVLTMPVVRRQHKIDYLGAAAIVGAVTCLLLYLDWQGSFSTAGPRAWRSCWAGPSRWRPRSSGSSVGPSSRSSPRPAAVPQPDLQRRQRLRLPGRRRHVRHHHLPAASRRSRASPTQSGLALLPAIVGIFSTSITSGAASSPAPAATRSTR